MPPLDRTPLTPLFAVPFMSYRWDDGAGLDAELAAVVLAAEAADAGGRAKSNVGGWQSRDDLPRWAGKPGETVRERAFALANHATQQLFRAHGVTQEFRWRYSMWANVNRDGDYNNLHIHPGATWSGVYYVDLGDPAPAGVPSGAITFASPLLAASHGFFASALPPQVTLTPQAGLMILFPSYLQHFVHPYRGRRPRISIAFNLIKDPYP